MKNLKKENTKNSLSRLYQKILFLIPMLLFGYFVNGQSINYNFNVLSHDCDSIVVQFYPKTSSASYSWSVWGPFTDQTFHKTSSLNAPIFKFQTNLFNQAGVSLNGVFWEIQSLYQIQTTTIVDSCNFLETSLYLDFPFNYNTLSWKAINNSTSQIISSSGNNANISLTAGDWNITYDIDSGTSCHYHSDSSLYVSVDCINYNTDFSINYLSTDSCVDTILFHNLNYNSNLFYEWEVDYPGGYNVNNDYQIDGISSGTHTETLSAYSDSNKVFLVESITKTFTTQSFSFFPNIQDSIISQDCDSTTIQFYGLSGGIATSYSWSGAFASSQENPIVTFENNGSTNIAHLLVSNATCSDDVDYSFSLDTNTCINPCDSFIANITSNIISQDCDSTTIQFFGLSGGIATSYSWSGAFASSQENPIVTFENNGSSNIAHLLVSNATCSDDVDFSFSLDTNTCINPCDTFIANITSTIISQDCDSTTIQFYGYDASSVFYGWNFPNGQTSSLSNPVMTFENSVLPNYVSLSIISNGFCFSSDSLYVSSNSSICDSVSFTVNVYSPSCDSNNIVFNNTSFYSNTVYYDWDIPSLSSANYVYNTFWGDIHAWDYPSGTYPATLNVYSDAALTNLIGSVTHSFTVNYFTSVQADFTHTVLNTFCGYSEVQLTDLSTGNPSSWLWEWTDLNGTVQVNSTLQNPIANLREGYNNVSLTLNDSLCGTSTVTYSIYINADSMVSNITDSLIFQSCDSVIFELYGWASITPNSWSWAIIGQNNTYTYNTQNITLNIPSSEYPLNIYLNTSLGLNCQYEDNVQLVLPNIGGLTASVSVTGATCLNICDNIITITPTGGQVPYLYSLNNGASTSSNVFANLCAGNYTIDVTDANGCTFNTTQYIDTTVGFNVDISAFGTNCDSIGFFMVEAFPSGGSGNYSYLWSDGSTSSLLFGGSALSYSVIVTDNVSGCTASASTPTTQNCNTISGTVYIDYNGNCIVDGNDIPFSQAYQVDLVDQLGGAFGLTDYLTFSDNGQYSILNVAADTYYFDVSGTAISSFSQGCTNTSVVVDANNPHPIVNLFMMPDTTSPVQDLSISMHTLWNVSPGHTNKINVRYCNEGTINMNGSVEINFDMALNYNYSTPSEDVLDLVTNTATYNFTGLQVGQCRNIYMNLTTPASLPIWTPVDYNATVYPISGDVTPANNIAYMFDTCSASWDPNDKSVYPEGNMTVDQKDHSYHIEFQNEGNAFATLVIVKDDLDDNLDISTLKNVSATHNFVLTIENTDELVFTFNNIHLPPKDVDEPNSKGSIDFTISQKADLPLGTIIQNTAEIYFDFNEPIITNTTVNVIVEKTTAIQELELLENVSIYPNPSDGVFHISLEDHNDLKAVEVYDVLAKKVFEANDLSGVKAIVNIKDVSNGIYLLKIITKNGIATERIVIAK